MVEETKGCLMVEHVKASGFTITSKQNLSAIKETGQFGHLTKNIYKESFVTTSSCRKIKMQDQW